MREQQWTSQDLECTTMMIRRRVVLPLEERRREMILLLHQDQECIIRAKQDYNQASLYLIRLELHNELRSLMKGKC